jgi:hypothetical protein
VTKADFSASPPDRLRRIRGSRREGIPSKATRVRIYCNNNFMNEPRAFPTKAPAASLNIHTLNVLYAYGYENVYELGPLLDVRNTRIPFEGKSAAGS